MKRALPIFFKSLVLSLVFLVTHTSTYANHIRGCDLRYVWVSGNTYNVILTVYGDCGVTSPSLTTSRPVICTYNAGSFFRSDTLTIQAPSGGTNVSQVCQADTALTTCNILSSTIPGTKKYVYSKNITVSGASHYWRFIFDGNMDGSNAGRAASITNITPSGTTIIQLVDTLDNTYHNNSNPDLTAIATPYFCVNNPDNYSPVAVDPNGDSLSFSLVAAVNNASATCSGTSTAGAVTYIGGTSATAPISTTSAFSFTKSNGQISFTTSATQNALVVYNIEEYRNDTFIGTCQREMTFIVQTCTEPPPHAVISGATNGVIVDSTHFEICENTGAFQFNLNPVENDTSYAIYMSATGVPAGATFTVTSDSTAHPHGVFSWTSTATTPGAYTFYVTYQDNACPIAGRNVVAYTVTIDAPPATITGTLNVCAGDTTTVNDATSGGTWSLSNGNAYVYLSTLGSVVGTTVGLDTLTYTYGPASCTTQAIVTVNQMPTPITGTLTVCVGKTTNLSSSPSGGTWTSSATLIATVGTSGIVSGASSGTSNISYTLSDGCAVGATVTVNPLPTTITGTLSVCVGLTTTLNSTPSGGTWSSSNGLIATVGSSSGIVNGIGSGTATITYTAGNNCFITAQVTVNPSPAAITPATPVSICLGTSSSLGDVTSGGVWSSANTGIATVGTGGSVTGVGLGTTTISYTLGSCSATKPVTIISTPAAISPISSTVCTGANDTLSDATAGGTWASGNALVATVGTSGIVLGVGAGNTTITYTFGACFVTATVTVHASPAAITPAGPVSVCVGASTSLGDVTAGGVWSSSSVGTATVGTGGSVTGVSAGTVTISYTVAGCPATKPVTVLTTPSAISPSSATVCVGSTTNLTDLTGGGTWTSSNPLDATVGSGSGVVTGVAAGTVTITYAIGTCSVTAPVTVNALPNAITPAGAVSICVGATATLGDTSPGGTWSSGSTSVATVGTSGIVTGVSAGTANISYTNAAGCSAVKQVTVAVTPAAITPLSSTICIAGTETLTNTVSGGTWTSTATAVATIGSGSGLVTGVTAGTTTISYTIGSCGTSATVTVSPGASAGSISGGSNVCVGSTLTLTDVAGGGIWSSSNTSVATVGTSGIVTGVSAGTATISYSVTNICGTVSALHTVNVVASGVQPIVGLPVICAGTFTTYTDATTGGTWSVTNADATISGTGLLTGISPGTDTIKYSVTDACGTFSTTKVVTIGPYLTAGTITGSSTVCQGSTIPLADLAPGGTWSVSNGDATVTSGGVVTGVAGGIDTVMYTTTSSCGTAVATHPVTVNPLPNAGAVTGPAITCAGMVVTYSDTATGGTWSLTNITHATINASTGSLTAISAGVDTVKYTVTNTCGTAVATEAITIGTFLTAGTISGASSICAGTATGLTDPAPGGVWSSSNTSIATVGTSGTVTGVSGGADTILYTVTSACGSVSATHPMTINPLPNAGSVSGPSTVCTGSVTTYSDTSSGGTWSISNSHATITSGGVVTALTTGTDTIKYTVSNGCGTAATTKIITIGSIVSAGTISGPGNVCIGSTITLTDGAGGGVWSSSNTSVATVGTSGIVSGVASGVVTISYTESGSCGSASATASVTVSPVPVAGSITGASTLCVGTFTIYTDGAPGGVWSATNGNATVSGGGVVTAVTAGVDTINYTVSNGCGSASASKVVTLLPSSGAGSITGSSSVCVGSTTLLTDGVPGGTWSASNSTATVGTAGLVTGITAGVDTIMYTVSSSCGTAVATHIVSVISTSGISAITGSNTVCVGALITLTDATPGGSWSSSNPHATVTTGGVVTGITPGVDTISYTISGACGTIAATKSITVNLLPSVTPISGSPAVCQGSATLFTDGTSGGVWTATNGNATVGISSGIVNGVTPGTDTIIYTVSVACGSVSTFKSIVVNPLPNAGTISGPDSVCVGSAITLADPAPGGSWSAGNADATVVGGVVTGVSAGTDPISYSVTNGCGTASAVQIVNVVGFPTSGTITGSSNVCVGSGITLLDGAPGGSWIASNGNALVAGPGIIDGVTVGIDTIFYVVTNACGTSAANKIINVNPVPFIGPISGPAMQCVATTVNYTDIVGGGVWTSSNPGVASIGVSSGVATGVATGIATITYTVTNIFGCPSTVTARDTVISVPVIPAISGSGNACVGATTALSDTLTGGTWSSSNTSVATIDMFSGVLTGVASGTAIITYTVTNMCGTSFVVRPEVVNALPSVAAITGTTHQCIGASSTLSDATVGGVWVSNNTAIATVGSSTGVVTGVAAGAVNINYVYTNLVGCTTIVFTPDTVVAAPVVAAITGTMSECTGMTTTLSDATPSGSWSSANPSIATVGAGTGVVSGVSAGTVSINYSVTNGAGCTTMVSAIDTVNGVPVVSSIFGSTNVCVGATTTLFDTTAGGSWSAVNGNATVTGGTVTGVTAGGDTILYTVTNGCGAGVALSAITVLTVPTVLPITGSSNVCVGMTTALADATAGGAWSASSGHATVGTAGTVTGVTAGTDTIMYSVANMCGVTTVTDVVTIGTVPATAGFINGASSVCAGATVTLSDTLSGGVWTASNSRASVSSGGVVTGLAAGADTIMYTVTNVCGGTTTMKAITVSQAPSAGTISGGSSVCVGFDVTLTDLGGAPGGAWASNNTSVATVSAGGNVLGVAPGSATISYSVSNTCGTHSTSHSVTVLPHNSCNTGVGAVNIADDIKIYPNPASTILQVDAPVRVNVMVLSVDGKVLIKQDNASTVDVSGLADGMYIIMIYDENSMLLKTAKFAKAQ